MRIGSLFSGIGGLELGLERSGLGRTIWQCESDPRCLAVLEKHWPLAKRFTDVRTLTPALDVDLICGGFPCQDVSAAGKRAGLAGTRSGLWFEYLRIVSELCPGWVVVENVASGARAWVDVVVKGLEQLGYACLPIPIAAVDVGAPHERQRIFIVAAHADTKSQTTSAKHAEVACAPAPTNAVSHELRVEQGRSGWAQWSGATEPADHRSTDVADADASRFEGPRSEAHEEWSRPPASHWRSPMPDMVRVVHGLSRRMDIDRPRPRIEALGNAVVPQCAEVIGHVIQELAR